MRRIATLGIAGCTLMVLSCWAKEVAVACIADLYPELGARAAAIERLSEQRRSFEPLFGAIAKEVALGRQSLRAASSALEDVALQHHPEYLRHIETAESGATVRTKLAGQLLSHLMRIGLDEASLFNASRKADVARQLEEMLADEASTGSGPRQPLE